MQELERTAEGTPIIDCHVTPMGGQVTFLCPACGCQHWHGADAAGDGDGPRVPHCIIEPRPLAHYHLRTVGRLTKEEYSELERAGRRGSALIRAQRRREHGRRPRKGG